VHLNAEDTRVHGRVRFKNIHSHMSTKSTCAGITDSLMASNMLQLCSGKTTFRYVRWIGNRSSYAATVRLSDDVSFASLSSVRTMGISHIWLRKRMSSRRLRGALLSFANYVGWDPTVIYERLRSSHWSSAWFYRDWTTVMAYWLVEQPSSYDASDEHIKLLIFCTVCCSHNPFGDRCFAAAVPIVYGTDCCSNLGI
jgi:hypothetical protein